MTEELSRETEQVLKAIDNITDRFLGSEEKTEYLFEEGAGTELWEMLSMKTDYSNQQIEKAMNELLDKDLLEEKEVEETKNRLEGMPPKSSVWYTEKNTKYIFDENLRELILEE